MFFSYNFHVQNIRKIDGVIVHYVEDTEFTFEVFRISQKRRMVAIFLPLRKIVPVVGMTRPFSQTVREKVSGPCWERQWFLS
ncbi:MAG: hypothetical protein R6V56_00330 [Lentisphaeria bacterium]